MTIGPEPTRQMERRSGRFGKPQLLDPRFEQRPGVMRSRPCFRMKLQRASPFEGEPFHGAVVKGDVCDLRRISLDREAVVLARDEHLVRRDLENGMVRPAVPEGELVRLQTCCQPEQLMAEADSEDGSLAEEMSHGLELGRERRGVAWAVREQDPVRTDGEDGGSV